MPRVNTYRCNLYYQNNKLYVSVYNSIYIVDTKQLTCEAVMQESSDGDEIKNMTVCGDTLWTTGRFDFYIRLWCLETRKFLKKTSTSASSIIAVENDQILTTNHAQVTSWDIRTFHSDRIISVDHAISWLMWDKENKALWISIPDEDVKIFY
eukprot:TRINITY_DN22803_c0_g1_i1.p1 TRINITY_DN22803_c0_g1~~TRINITY_DN22803_c0_g1_i1.p1  ORF type:complete len:152 (-),score=10.98 TRINITY_DN22803_c0_g1_i1:192-647(-)